MTETHGEFRPPRPHPEMPANLDSAYNKSKISTEQNALKPESFLLPDGSNARFIKEHQNYVDYRKRNFVSHDTAEYKLAKSFEAALFDRINQNAWFGEKVKMIMPSEYDDLANGMDGVLEFSGEEGPKNYLGLGIDVTYSHNPEEKFRIIKEQIDERRLGTVEYFRNSDGTDEGPLDHLPRAVVVLNAADATRVVRDWDKGAEDSGNVYRQVLLRQLEMQLEAYHAYADKLEKADRKRFAIARFFYRSKKIVSKLLNEIATPEEREQLDNHPTVQEVKYQLEEFGFLPKPEKT